jgi:release factor glutamine methyltransferase
MAPLNAEVWTSRALLDWMNERFTTSGVEPPRLVAEMLLSSVLQQQRIDMYADIDRPATDAERAALRPLVQRALQGEPVQHILGEAWFFGMPFLVDRSALIPRSATETMVEHVLQWWRTRETIDDGCIADIGTGGGCIAIALAANLPETAVIATDISEEALDLARRNAERHGVVDRIEFRLGKGLDPLGDSELFDAMCSNPPYIPDHEFQSLDASVADWEPPAALCGGPDGLEVAGPLITGGGEHLRHGGLLIVEIATSSAKAAQSLAGESPNLQNENILRDQHGDARFITAVR